MLVMCCRQKRSLEAIVHQRQISILATLFIGKQTLRLQISLKVVLLLVLGYLTVFVCIIFAHDEPFITSDPSMHVIFFGYFSAILKL